MVQDSYGPPPNGGRPPAVDKLTPLVPVRVRDCGRLLVAFLVFATVGVVAASFASGRPSEQPPDFASTPQFRTAVEEARERQAREAARRASPAAAAERRKSATAYADATDGEALAIATDTFPSAFADVWDDPGLAPGDRVERYLDEYSARIERANGLGHAIVESNVPLLARDETGELRPVELALEDRGSHLASANPIVPVEFSKDARRGVSFARSGLRLALEEPADPETSKGRRTRDRLFHANAKKDADFFVVPKPLGVEAFFVLRSSDSPERLALDFDLPRGAALRRTTDGSGAVEVTATDGKRLALIPPANTLDADGQPVETAVLVAGDKLVLRVDHRSRDVHYPLLTDPVISEFSAGGGFNGTQWRPGTRQTNTGWFSGWLGPWDGANGAGAVGLNLWSAPELHYNHGDYAEWYLTPYRDNVVIPAVSWGTSHWGWATMAQYGSRTRASRAVRS